MPGMRAFKGFFAFPDILSKITKNVLKYHKQYDILFLSSEDPGVRQSFPVRF